MNDDIRFELEELTETAGNLYGLAYTLQAALESPGSSDCFTKAACILVNEMKSFSERMQNLYSTVEGAA